ncbi:MAG: MBL fold metallo-hydrolase [Terriglobales bacterium]
MAFSFTVLGSGSKGNACVIASSRTRLLLDCGFSRRELTARLRYAGLDPAQLDAILITHEHSDHVAGLPRFAAATAAPVWLTPATRAALGPAGEKLERVEAFAAGFTFTIGDIEVTPFTVPHDAADPVAFSFRAEGLRAVIVTDLGSLTANVCDQLRAADAAVIESNHDLEMLKTGGYPWALKQRVLSRVGHLSNDTLAEFLATAFDGAARHLVLAHLSENNNLPALARLSAQRALAGRHAPTLHLASQSTPLPTIAL